MPKQIIKPSTTPKSISKLNISAIRTLIEQLTVDDKSQLIKELYSDKPVWQFTADKENIHTKIIVASTKQEAIKIIASSEWFKCIHITSDGYDVTLWEYDENYRQCFACDHTSKKIFNKHYHPASEISTYNWEEFCNCIIRNDGSLTQLKML